MHIDPPKTWGVRGMDGPIRAAVDVLVEPVSGDSHYSWLHGALVGYEGEFNEVTHHAQYTAFLRPTSPAA